MLKLNTLQLPFLRLCLATLLIMQANNSSATTQRYTFGIVPQQSATRLAQLWGPLLDAVSESSAYQLEFKTAPSISEFEKRLAAGEYDFAYMNPYHYQIFSERNGYLAFAKNKHKKLNGIIVVSIDSDEVITHVAQLNGQRVAFPAPRAFAASVIVQGYLNQQGLDFSPNYVGSHDSVYRAVAAGLYPAGGGIPRTFANTAPEVAKKLRVLWTSAEFTPHAIAAHPRVAKMVVAKVQQALLSLDSHSQQLNLLDALKMNGFESAEDKDWDDVRQLKIGGLQE